MRYLILSSCLLAMTAALPAQAEMKIITDLEVTASLVEQIAGEHATVTAMMPRDANPHHYQLSPSQAGAAQGADLVFWVGAGLTPQVARVIEGMGLEPVAHRPFAHGEDAGEHDDHDDHAAEEKQDDHDDHAAHDNDAHEEGDDHAEHDHGNQDVHPWLNPDLALIAVHEIAETLAAADPSNAATYEANSEKLEADLKQVFARMETTLHPVHETPFLTGHAAYGPFSAHFELNLLGSVASAEDQKPGASHMAELREQAMAGEFACAFADAGHAAKVLTTITENTPAKIGVLDPAGALQDAGPALYQRVMTALAVDLAACLGGS